MMPTLTQTNYGGSDIPAYLMLGGGAGTYALSKTLSNAFQRGGYGKQPVIPRDTLEKIIRFAQSRNGRKDWTDFAYNYAQTGSDAARAELLQGRGKSVAEEMPKLKRFAGSTFGRLADFLETPFGVSIGENAASRNLRDRIKGFLHEAKDIMGEAHYASFALGPRDAYIKMVNEGKFNETLGSLADSIMEARKNYASSSNLAGRAFNTPEQYFSWKMRDVIGAASSIPRRRDFSSTRAYIDALKDYFKYGGKNPVYSSLFEKTKMFDTRDKLIRALASERHPLNVSIDSLANESIGSIMSKIVGDTNAWERVGDDLVIKGRRQTPAGRNMADIMQNRTLLQEFVDPTLGRKFRQAPSNYTKALRLGRRVLALAKRRTRVGAALAVGGGLASILYNRLGKEKRAADERADLRVTPTDLLITAAGLGSGVSARNYARRFKARDFNPFGDVHVTMLGGTKAYDPEARDLIAKSMSIAEKASEVFRSGDQNRIRGFVSRLEKEAPGLNPILRDQVSSISDLLTKGAIGSNTPSAVEAFLPKRVLSAMRLDSFSAQTQATADMLRKNGIKIDDHILRATTSSYNPKTKIYDPYQAYLPVELGQDRLGKSDAFVQVGMHPQEDLLRTERLRRGAKVYRVASDFGPGNFNQPETWIGGQNYMRIRDPKLYDRIIMPGYDYFRGTEKLGPEMHGMKPTLGVGNIAVSPIFERTTFSDQLASRTGKGRVKAMYTFGGGAGGFLGVGEPINRGKKQYSLGRNRVFDDILSALRSKHGDNFDLNVYVGNALDDVDAKIKGENGAYQPGELPHNRRLRKMLRKIENVTMSDTERRAKGLPPLTTKQRALRERFKGLHLVRGVPQSQLASAYANSDYIFMLPGSTSAEFASIKDNPSGIRGKLISMIPDEELAGRLKPGQQNWMARHFGTNADYIESLVPGSTRVNLSSKTRAKDILAAISSDAKTVAKPVVNNESAWKSVTKAIKRDVRLGRLGRVGKLGLIASPFVAAGVYKANRAHKIVKKLVSKNNEPYQAPLGRGIAGVAGLASLGGLMYYLNRQRRKKEDDDMQESQKQENQKHAFVLTKSGSDKVKRQIAIARVRGLWKQAGAAATFGKAFTNLGRAFLATGSGMGQLGLGTAQALGTTGKYATKATNRYASLLLGSRLSPLMTNAAKLGISDAQRLAAHKAYNREMNKVYLTRLLSFAGLGGGLAAANEANRYDFY